MAKKVFNSDAHSNHQLSAHKFVGFFLITLLLGLMSVSAWSVEEDNLKISLVNALDHSTVPGVGITAYERGDTGDLIWRRSGTTDDSGFLSLNLPGLGDGAIYILKAKPYGTGSVYSEEITDTGAIDFTEGSMEVHVFRGADGSDLVEHPVTLYERISDSENKWRASGKTGSDGIIRFDPVGLGHGKVFFLKAKNPYDGRSKYSQDITAVGQYGFAVGNKLLSVRLVNAISGQGVADIDVKVYRGESDDSLHGIITKKTDSTGQVDFDLDGLGSGTTYVARVRPYGTNTVYSDNITNTGPMEFHVGKVQVELSNDDKKQPLPEHEIVLYEKTGDGQVHWRTKGITDSAGTVRFDPDGLGAGRIYVARVKNVFGNGKKYYSPWITQVGIVDFAITKDGDGSLDLSPPEISIGSPLDGGNVTENGFEVTGFAGDDHEIDRVTLSVTDPVKGQTEITATYNTDTGAWSANVTDAMITLNNDIALVATAFDLAQNETAASITVSVVDDIEGPEISFTSHTDGDEVPVTGFLLSGTAIDLTGVASLQASLDDPVVGRTIDNQDVDIADSGTWTLAVDSGKMTEGQSVTITLDAIDSVGNASSAAITLNAVAVDFTGQHMINRITFGATPALLQEVESLGAQGLLDQQLDPNGIDDSAFESMIASNMPATREQLQAWTLLHMIGSQRQLREVMTWFWDNHFNTDIDTTRQNADGVEVSDTVTYELAENQAFRANALGNFRELLEISSRSPAMLIYLDSISNVVNDSNENYTRELLELHTMGVNGGYTHHDIEAGAEIFTGWHLDVQNGVFAFDPGQHNSVVHTVFGVDVPAGGVEQGEQFLDIIASHSSTASYICTKLIEVFVSDIPPGTLVSRCADTFLGATDAADQIAQVLRTVLESAEFYDPAYYRGKIKTPVKFVVGALRNLEAQSDGQDLIGPIAAMGIRLYQNPVPTGWSEIGEDWINASLLIERMKWVNRFVRNAPGNEASVIDPLTFYPVYGFETAQGIVGFLLQITVGNDFTELSRQQALDVLGAGGIDLSDPGADQRLRQMNGTVLNFPQYQYQ